MVPSDADNPVAEKVIVAGVPVKRVAVNVVVADCPCVTVADKGFCVSENVNDGGAPVTLKS